MLLLRRVVFYIFALIYLILCPLMLGHMLGFMYNPLTQHLVKTGLIYVSTNPPEASVYVDGRLINQKTPTVLRDLPPGKHFIRIELDGYNDWEGNVPVIGKKATLLANTLLIPQAWPVKTISDSPYQNIFIVAPDILITTNPVLSEIDVYHTTNGIGENFTQESLQPKTPLLSKESIYADGTLVHVYTALLSPFVLLEANIKDKHKFLWINFNEKPAVIEDISDLFPQDPIRIAWNNTDDNIFAFFPDHIYRINVKDKAIFPQRPQGLVPLARSPSPNETLFINDNNDMIIKDGRWIKLVPKADFALTPQVCAIAKSKPGTHFYFEEKTGELFFLDEQGDLAAAQILPYHPILNIPIPDALRFKAAGEK